MNFVKLCQNYKKVLVFPVLHSKVHILRRFSKKLRGRASSRPQLLEALTTMQCNAMPSIVIQSTELHCNTPLFILNFHYTIFCKFLDYPLIILYPASWFSSLLPELDNFNYVIYVIIYVIVIYQYLQKKMPYNKNYQPPSS